MKSKRASQETVRLFTSGNSQAIRLPKKYRLPGQTARIRKEGKSLVITPEEDVWERFERGVEGLAATRVIEDLKREQPSDAEVRGKAFP